MRKTSTGLAVLLLAAAAGLLSHEWFGHAARSNDVTAHLSAEKTSLRVGEDTRLRVVLRNEGGRAVRLVDVGDGSEVGWRTPVVAWSIVKDDAARPHPSEPPAGARARDCGNVNSLGWGEVFRLAPGEAKEIYSADWLPHFPGPGVYRVAFLYANRPSIEWANQEFSFGFNNPLEMWRVRHSTEAAAASNEIVFTVRD